MQSVLFMLLTRHVQMHTVMVQLQQYCKSLCIPLPGNIWHHTKIRFVNQCSLEALSRSLSMAENLHLNCIAHTQPNALHLMKYRGNWNEFWNNDILLLYFTNKQKTSTINNKTTKSLFAFYRISYLSVLFSKVEVMV